MPNLDVPAPPGDLYDVPDPLPRGSPGDVIWAERVAAPRGARAWRVLYRSETIHGDPIGVSGIIVAPESRPPEGGFPVVGYGHGTTGLGDDCAPSKDARPLRDDASDGVGGVLVPPLWTDGLIVAATDYEGLGTPGRHPYIVGGSEGRSVLDAIRAARHLLPGVAGAGSLVLGVSQGGHAALFAGELASTYAPELDLLGVVALAPGAELTRAAMLVANDRTAVGFAVAIGAGFEAAYPEARLEDVLTPSALERLDIVDTGCIDDILEVFSRPVEEVLRIEAIVRPPWPGLLEANTPGRVRTAAPIVVAQGTADRLVLPELTDALVARLCATGDTVTVRRYAGAGHLGLADAAAPDIRRWVRDRLAGHEVAEAACPV